MKIAGHDIAVCSWSLQPINMTDLIDQVRELTLEHVQLAIGPLVAMDDARRTAEIDIFRASGVHMTAGMIGFSGEDYSTIAQIAQTGGYVPDATWEARRAVTLSAAKIVADLGGDKLTTHIGFVPVSSDANYPHLLSRLRSLADEMSRQGVRLGLETGQEPATELLKFLNDLNHRNVFVNFDPANMLLYGCGDPIDAVATLGRHIAHVHVKDARMSNKPGLTWGEEVPFGSGAVGAGKFLDALDDVGYDGPLAIEREAGLDRLEDIATAITSLQDAELEAE